MNMLVCLTCYNDLIKNNQNLLSGSKFERWAHTDVNKQRQVGVDG
jgi:hypothetical protein